jgi:putative glutamine amidotransferase
VRRPLIAVPGRFAASASTLRYGAVVNARKLLEAVHRAGGEALTVLPHARSGVADVVTIDQRLSWAEGVLLPGGGDLHPSVYGQQPASEHLYDVDAEQDAFDLTIAQWALDRGLPVLAICRGMHVMNAARGGDLEQHMDQPHRHAMHAVHVTHQFAQAIGEEERAQQGLLHISCYHHQRIRRLAAGLTSAVMADDGTIEAVVDEASPGWLLGVQWHPEDTADTDPRQQALFRAFVQAAGGSDDRLIGDGNDNSDLAQR